MDGTLIDSMHYWRNLGREYLRSKGVMGNLDEIIERIKPMTMMESAALFVEEFHLPLTDREAAAEMNERIEQHYREDILLKRGVKEYLERLKEAQVKMCVASATDKYLMQQCLERLGILDYFEFLISCEEVGAGKDRPDVYLAASRRLGGMPEETAVYEDALYAVRTAKKAGYYVVGIFEECAAHKWDEVKAQADEALLAWI